MVSGNAIETVALVGLGALGCAYLGKITETLPLDAIQVIADGKRAERYRKNGVTLNGKRLDFPVAEPGTLRPADLVIFTVKFNQLEEAIALARGAVGPNTIVISLLNGITSEEVIAAAYGWDNVLLSLSLGIDATRVGDATAVTVYGTIPFGEARNKPGEYSERVLRLKAFFDRVGLRSEIPEDMKLALWRKFMLNVGVNQTSAVVGTGYGALQKEGAARDIAVAAMREVVTLAPYEGVALGEKDIEQAMAVMMTLSPDGKCSMLQDIEARRKTEVAIFGGTVLALAAKHGVAAPVNGMLVRILRAKEENF
ncbi:2-dehydropantoate 2-reductase [uncultured delta proteobacterium]|uniref:2-dehydropantoate 2-reductase n=1 Tax=uncultured delta proteobacterium TaxID=34034 RepID=A0A212KFE2_9DELT|nr:2-dehydropantoate 2-reductase [uncultured delta proteobacterium]